MLKLYSGGFDFWRAGARALNARLTSYGTGSLTSVGDCKHSPGDMLKGITITKLCQEPNGRFRKEIRGANLDTG